MNTAQAKHATPSKERKKWLKFVSVRGMYEKSVLVRRSIHVFEYYQDLEAREVIAEPAMFCEKSVLVNGYFRVRTDREYYPVFGKCGIPHDERSSLAKEFAQIQTDGQGIWRRKTLIRNLIKSDRLKRNQAEQDRRLAKDIPRCELAARLGIPVAMATEEILEAKRNQIAILRTIREIKKLTNENKNDENEHRI